MRDDDLRVQVTSCKALSNLDKDDPNNFLYPNKIYPLYPTQRILRKPELDIVFIHGLLGGVFVTWRQKDRDEKSPYGIYGKGDVVIDGHSDTKGESG